mmetsp:Transcript_11698/g.39972  ORF Transcript_11698/g.39972 Transcript_11698/m.39972 type:complete len:220 (-) Transcript_11698:389-1048(-)
MHVRSATQSPDHVAPVQRHVDVSVVLGVGQKTGRWMGATRILSSLTSQSWTTQALEPRCTPPSVAVEPAKGVVRLDEALVERDEGVLRAARGGHARAGHDALKPSARAREGLEGVRALEVAQSHVHALEEGRRRHVRQGEGLPEEERPLEVVLVAAQRGVQRGTRVLGRRGAAVALVHEQGEEGRVEALVQVPVPLLHARALLLPGAREHEPPFPRPIC